MQITSLGFRTDVMLLTLQGGEVDDRGDHLVVRSPRAPEFWWGNFVLFRAAPTSGDLGRWERAFSAGLPHAAHRTFGVDATAADASGCAEFVAAGYDVDCSSVLTASRLHEPPRGSAGATFRSLDLTNPRELEAAVDVQVANASPSAPPGHGDFLVHRMESMRALQEAGRGSWFGAFLGGRMLSGLGLFTDGSGIARFQNVDTRPEARRRGLAGALVHHAGAHGVAEWGVTTLVIVADPGYHAIDVYRSVGFAVAETQVQLERAPQQPEA